MRITGGRLAACALAASFLLSACGSDSASASASASDPTDLPVVEEIIVRYERGGPLETSRGLPWGAQCVSDDYRKQLTRDRALGARMHVVRIEPGVTPRVATRIARQMQQCPYIEWAEADVIVFTLP